MARASNAHKTTPARTTSDVLQEIARETLGIETLTTRHSDSLDFHEVAVWTVRKALEEAYEAGRKSR